MTSQDTAAATKDKAATPRPFFLDNANVDRLLTMIMDIALEVSILRDRVDTHEHVASIRGSFTSDDIENFEAPSDVKLARDAWRRRFIDKLMSSVEAEYHPT